MRKLLKNHKGLTMVEVLVTVALLAIVIVPCLSSFVVAQRGNVLAKQTFDEYTAAANLMEELKGQGPYANTGEIFDAIKAHQKSDDGIHIYYQVTEDYVNIWVFHGEETDYNYETDPPADFEGLILKGVIAP